MYLTSRSTVTRSERRVRVATCLYVAVSWPISTACVSTMSQGRTSWFFSCVLLRERGVVRYAVCVRGSVVPPSE
jgi:hypothetical protein